MLKKLIFVLFLTAFLVLPFFISAQNEVYLVEIDGEIKAGTFEYLKRVNKLAEKAGADYLIIKLDTPGGLLNPTKDIVNLLLESKTKSIVFVNKQGGWAYSAGTFILLSADFAFLHPTASIGACQPQEMFSQNDADNKVVEGMVSWIKSLARTQDRNIDIAEKFVRENLTLIGEEAKESNIVDGVVENLDQLLAKINLEQAEIIKIEATAIEKFFDLLSHPYLVSLFLILGGLGLIFAFQSGEFELSGISGLILLLIGLWGMGVITFNVLGLIFLGLGLFLIILEILEPGFGIFGFLGIASIIFGIFTLEGEPLLSPGIFDRVTMFVLGAVLAITVLFIIISQRAIKAIKKKPLTGVESLVGLEAEVIKEINPLGKVVLKNETWSAKSIDGKIIAAKTKVKIVKIEGNTLFVRP